MSDRSKSIEDRSYAVDVQSVVGAGFARRLGNDPNSTPKPAPTGSWILKCVTPRGDAGGCREFPESFYFFLMVLIDSEGKITELRIFPDRKFPMKRAELKSRR
jgi:hypothetical protein